LENNNFYAYIYFMLYDFCIKNLENLNKGEDMKPSDRINELVKHTGCIHYDTAIMQYLDEQYEKEEKVKEPQWPDNWKCSKHGEAWSSSDKYPKGCCECHEAFFANKMKTEMIKAWKDAKG